MEYGSSIWDMGYGLLIWEMTVSIWSSPISIRDVLSLWRGPTGKDEPRDAVNERLALLATALVLGPAIYCSPC